MSEQNKCALCDVQLANTVLDYPYTAEHAWMGPRSSGKLTREVDLKIPICESCKNKREKRESIPGCIAGIGCLTFLGVLAYSIIAYWDADPPGFLVPVLVGSFVVVFTIIVVGKLMERVERKRIFNWLRVHDFDTWSEITFKDLRAKR